MKYYLVISTLAWVLLGFNSIKKPSAKAAKKQLDEFCSFVPSGNTLIQNDTIAVQGFYMSKGEVTNIQYQEFIAYLKRTNQTDLLKIAEVDSLNWKTELKWGNDAYVEHYHDHPAYNNYPVVNVSREGAELYCEWLTKMYDSLSGGELKVKFRIPTHQEWMRAVQGSHFKSSYSWGGPYLRNAKGQYLANFVRCGAENITRNPESGQFEVTTKNVGYHFDTDNADVTAPSISYWPNEFGIYNMNGNVSELVSDKKIVVGGDWRSPGYDIRNESSRTYTGSSVTVGFRVVASWVEN